MYEIQNDYKYIIKKKSYLASLAVFSCSVVTLQKYSLVESDIEIQTNLYLLTMRTISARIH